MNDSAVFSGRLFDRLTEYYRPDSVFLDIDSIPGAVDFREIVRQDVKKSGVFLAVIGRYWAGTPDRPRRIDEPADHVRIEDVLALSASSFFNNTEALRDGLRRGVRFRLLIFDHKEANRSNLDTYFTYFALNSTGRDWSTKNSELAAETFRLLRNEAKESYPGSIEVRWWKGPFMNSFWIRDSGTANALGHVEITYYGDVNLNPSMRFGQLSPRMTASLQQQFDYLWGEAPAEGE